VIVVVGSLAWRDAPAPGPAGRACGIAIAAAARGATAEVVGRVGDDPRGDSLVIALARAGVGHAAVLRDPTRETPVLTPIGEPEDPDPFADDAPTSVPPATDRPRLAPADVGLGLQYLTSFGVLVVADDVPPDAVPACVEGAGFAGAHLVVLVPAGRPLPDDLPADATILEAPDGGDDLAFITLVGEYAAALDGGMAPAEAFAAAAGAASVAPAVR
jgi:sugar/nucleoside kinase (ribokinase family)